MQFDWAALMRAGIAARGLRPEDFWNLTPAELMLLLGRGAPVPMGRARLAELSAAFPDEGRVTDAG